MTALAPLPRHVDVAAHLDVAAWLDLWLANGGTVQAMRDMLFLGFADLADNHLGNELLAASNEGGMTRAIFEHVRRHRLDLTVDRCATAAGWVRLMNREGLRVMVSPDGELELGGTPAWVAIDDDDTAAQALTRLRGLLAEAACPAWHDEIVRHVQRRGRCENGWAVIRPAATAVSAVVD